MATYDTTSTTNYTTWLAELAPATSMGTALELIIDSVSTGGNRAHTLLSGVLPPAPLGSDSISRVKLVLTYLFTPLGAVSITDDVNIYSLTTPWSEVNATWNIYQTGLNWTLAGGDYRTFLSGTHITRPSTTRDSTTGSFGFDISGLGLNWGSRYNVLLAGTTSSNRYDFVSNDSSTSTVAILPHLVVSYVNNPPPAVTDLRCTPDLSLSEASYTYRRRTTLQWSASNAADFVRYRIRHGTTNSPSAMTHLAFVYSRGSTSYLDSTIYAASTQYYVIYPEDNMNQSASTNALVSNVASFNVPILNGMGPVQSSASTLGNVTYQITPNDMTTAKKAKVAWGDGGFSYTQGLDSAGANFIANHRYSKATTSFNVRAQVENIYGFRGPVVTSTFTVHNLSPIAKITTSPSRQRTASTFSFGSGPTSTATAVTAGAIRIDIRNPCPSDGVATRFRTRSSNTTGGNFYAQLWRLEGQNLRCIYSDLLTTSTANSIIGRNVDWVVKKGDYVGIHPTGAGNFTLSGNSQHYFITYGTAVSPGTILPRYRFSLSGDVMSVSARISVANTNPVHFTSKDSYARGSNRSINRFRWAPNYAGDFGAAYATGGSYTTGATTNFYWAWTTATTQFVAVRAVDDTNASSIDVSGVVIETEATFRIPNNIRDTVTEIKEKRQRAFTVSPAIARDYGVFDFGAIEPRQFTIRGHAFTRGTGVTPPSPPADIGSITSAFVNRARIIFQPTSQATTTNGYMMDSPATQTSSDPLAVDWTMTVIEAK